MQHVQIRLVFESALELMSLTQLEKFAIGDNPKGMPKPVKFNSDLAPVYSLRFCPAREWNSGLALRSPLKRTEPQTLSQSL